MHRRRKKRKGSKENRLTNEASSRSLYSTCTSKRYRLLSYLWMGPYSRRRHPPLSARHSTGLETALTTRNTGATRVVTVVKPVGTNNQRKHQGGRCGETDAYNRGWDATRLL
jgi:hypothetical protein